MAAHAHAHGDDHNVNVEHEESDINVRAIIWFAIVLAVIVILVDVAMYGTFRVLDVLEVRDDPFVTPTAAPAGTLPPSPRLQTTPWEDLKQFKADQQAYVDGYSWVDQQGGVAHIPIERAKALLLERGLPTRAAQGQADPTEGTHAYAYGESSGGRNLPASGPDASSGQPGAAAGAAAPGAAAPPGSAPAKPGGAGQ